MKKQQFYDACIKGDLKTAENLIEFIKEGINYQRRDGFSPLMYAARRGYAEILDLLIKKNAKIDLQSADGETALIMAIKEGQTNIIERLIKCNPDLNIQDNAGCTALIYASMGGQEGIVNLLIKEGTAIDLQCKTGGTALLWASSRRYWESVEVLINSGADINFECKNNFTAHDYAVKNNDIKIQFLLQKNDKKTVGSLLINACQNKNEEDVLFIYDRGADFFIENEEGESAFKLLKRKRKLPGGLQSLKEKLVLDKMISESHDFGESL